MKKQLLKLTAFLLFLIVALASSCQPEEPKEIEYTISPTSLNFDATGGEGGFTVSIKSPAIVESIESLSAWCQVSTSGVSPVNVIVTVVPNANYFEPRNTTVVVNMKLGENKTSTIVQITQAGVEIPEWVLIDGIKWATRNVDMPGTFAAKPEDPGMFYQWNRKVGWSATDPMINSDGGTTWDDSWPDYPENGIWDKNNPCPPSWRVPTNTELESLANVNGEWTTINGVSGRVIGSKNDLLFLPATGMRSGGGLHNVDVHGRYWSSIPSGVGVFYLHFSISEFMVFRSGSPRIGSSIRCVAE